MKFVYTTVDATHGWTFPAWVQTRCDGPSGSYIMFWDGISQRCRNCLEAAGVDGWESLSQVSTAQWRGLRSLGSGSLSTIKREAKKQGVDLPNILSKMLPAWERADWPTPATGKE